MKKITIALLLAVSNFYIISACHKQDIPRKKQCQIKLIEDVHQINPSFTRGYITNYAYTKKRLLDSLTVTPAFTVGTSVNVKIGYDNQGNPIETKDNENRIHKLIYENGRVVRVDMLGADNLFHTKYTFTYDSQGRIFERTQGPLVVRWEYEGESKNYVRKLYMADMFPNPPGLEVYSKFEYQYDNKVNPMTTWPNTTLVPFYFEVIENRSFDFEPIPENNWVSQRVSHILHASLLLAREYFYVYQYDDVYPVKYDLTLVSHNPFMNRTDTTRGTAKFTYDCTGTINHPKF